MAIQKVIGDRTYSFARVSAVNALDLELSLAKVINTGDLLGSLDLSVLEVFKKDPKSRTAEDTVKLAGLGVQMATMFTEIAQRLTHQELVRLMKMVFDVVSCDGVTIENINKTFENRPRDIWLVFIEGLKVNLGPLGEGLLQKQQGT